MATRQLACSSCSIRDRAVCAALSDDDIARLNAISHFKHFPAGSVILRDHDELGYYANVVSGVVKLTKTLGDGRQQIVGLQFPSDFLGRPFRTRSPYFAEAASDVTLCTFERSQFERLVKETPDIERRLYQHTLDELDAAQEWMVLLGRKTAGEKVASFLLMIARRTAQIGSASSPSGSIKIELALSRSEIADYLGLTIETVSRQITSLKRCGVIVLEGARMVVIPDPTKLERLAEQMAG